MNGILDKIGAVFSKIFAWFRGPGIPAPLPIQEPRSERIKADKNPEDAKKRGQFTENLGELLDHLDEAFTAYSIPTDIVLGYLDKDELLGLRKLGAHVPHPWLMLQTPFGEEVKIKNRGEEYPGMMFVALVLGRHEEKDRSNPDFMLAIKQNKLPWYVEHKNGVPYKFGMGFRFHGEGIKRMWWMGSWVVITPDGTIEFCRETRVKKVTLKRGKNAGLSYPQKIRCYSELYSSSFEEHNEQGIHELKNIFKSMYTWWVSRPLRWSVTVKKNGERVTFGVDKSLTKKYFADRNKVVDDKGRTKRIIHYVKEHERIRDDKKYVVKEHLRGLSKFTWKGYDCTVIAPEFNELPTAMFAGAAMEVDKKDFVPDPSIVYYQTSKVGLELARAEDARAKQ